MLVKYSYNDINVINEQGLQGSNKLLQLPIHTIHAHTYKHIPTYKQ